MPTRCRGYARIAQRHDLAPVQAAVLCVAAGQPRGMPGFPCPATVALCT